MLNDRCITPVIVNLGQHAGTISSLKKIFLLVKAILSIVVKPDSLIKFVEDRPGHGFRYAMDNTMVTGELGWEPSVTFEEGLE